MWSSGGVWNGRVEYEMCNMEYDTRKRSGMQGGEEEGRTRSPKCDTGKVGDDLLGGFIEFLSLVEDFISSLIQVEFWVGQSTRETTTSCRFCDAISKIIFDFLDGNVGGISSEGNISERESRRNNTSVVGDFGIGNSFGNNKDETNIRCSGKASGTDFLNSLV